LANLRIQNSAVSNNHVSLQLLAAGIERLLKILLLLKDKYINGGFPELQIAKKRFMDYDSGHGIKKMLAELINYSGSLKVMQVHPMLVKDVEFLKKDIKFKEFISILTEFAISQRYYYIDTIILDKPNTKVNPFQLFKNFICSFSQGVDVSKMSYEDEERMVVKSAIICIEKGIVAMSRFFTHGLGDEGKRYYGDFSEFILLDEENLGSLKYTEKRVPLRDTHRPLRLISFRFLKLAIFSRSKVLHQSEIIEWNLLVRKVTVYFTGERYYLVKIGNEVFALTGKTASYFRIPVYNKSRHLKPRQAALFLLEEAKKLNLVAKWGNS
jgi:hypothetical protein